MEKKMKRVLVTGTTGFVGSHAVEALLKAEALHVIAACRNPSRLPPAAQQIEQRAGDLRDEQYLAGLCKAGDVLVHAAAWTSLYGHAKYSGRHFLQPTLDLIDAAIKAGVKRFIFISTTSAAAPSASSNPQSRGIPRLFWPHLCNVIRIEERLRETAG
jgi:nucleoside-diphosphate-sugar epimerase